MGGGCSKFNRINPPLYLPPVFGGRRFTQKYQFCKRLYVSDFFNHYYNNSNYSLPYSISFLTDWVQKFTISKGYHLEFDICKKLVIEAIINQGFSTKKEINSAFESIIILQSIREVPHNYKDNQK
jgi:hypothetical protein